MTPRAGDGSPQEQPERARRVLRERAALLARPLEEDVADGDADVLAFEVAGQRYGVEARYVREVLPLPPMTRVGGASHGLAGIINVRGEVLAVADVRALTGMGPGDRASHVLVLDGAGAPLGLLADAAPDLVTVPLEGAAGGVQEGVAAGIVLRITHELVVLDGSELLTDPRLFVQADGTS